MTKLDPITDPAPVRCSWVRWQMVLILMAFTGLNHFHRQSLPAVVQDIMRDCQFSEVQMGTIYSAFLLGYVLSMIAGGRLADVRGGWYALVLSGFGTGILVAATGLCGFAVLAGITSFLVVRFLMGVFTAPLFPAAGRIVGAWIPFETRGWANGLVLGATTIGVALAPIVFGKTADLMGWRCACGLMGALTLLLTCIWFWFGRNQPAEHPRVTAAELALINTSSTAATQTRTFDFRQWLKNPSLFFLTINYAAVGYYEYTLFYWMKYYFSQVRGYPEDTSRYFTGIVSAAMIVAMPLGGVLSDWLVRVWNYRAGRMSVPIFGMLASAVLLFAATRAQEQATVVGLFFLAHAAIGLCEAPTWVAALEIGKEQCGTSAAIVNTGGNLGGMLAPTITAYVASKYEWNTSFALASIVCLFGVVQWLGVRLVPPDGRRHSETTAEKPDAVQ